MDGDGINIVGDVGPCSFVRVGTESKALLLLFFELFNFIGGTVIERAF